jgi:hypothetical protein
LEAFVKLAPAERRVFFETAASKIGIIPTIAEKDFWVCWTLKILFGMSDVNKQLIFKGGTSLSKVYQVIERFSEDIDISIDKAYLGFGDLHDPEKMTSRKQKEKAIESLAAACSDYVCTRLQADLKEIIAGSLTESAWDLLIDPNDSDKQTLLFYYPKSMADSSSIYIEQAVKIEIGARSDHWPIETRILRSIVAEQIPQSISNPSVEVRVLTAKRSFWEKATILHMYAYFPESKLVPTRQSRHYYDFFRLLNSPYKAEAVNDLRLLDRVAEHKGIYFRAGWANYHLAKKGSLRLLPAARVHIEMKRDYLAMGEMFFGQVPKWDDIIATIESFEKEFNSCV